MNHPLKSLGCSLHAIRRHWLAVAKGMIESVPWFVRSTLASAWGVIRMREEWVANYGATQTMMVPWTMGMKVEMEKSGQAQIISGGRIKKVLLISETKVLTKGKYPLKFLNFKVPCLGGNKELLPEWIKYQKRRSIVQWGVANQQAESFSCVRSVSSRI